MSGLLTRLIVRAVRTESPVQPILSSRYSPPEPVASAMAPTLTEEISRNVETAPQGVRAQSAGPAEPDRVEAEFNEERLPEPDIAVQVIQTRADTRPPSAVPPPARVGPEPSIEAAPENPPRKQERFDEPSTPPARPPAPILVRSHEPAVEPPLAGFEPSTPGKRLETVTEGQAEADPMPALIVREERVRETSPLLTSFVVERRDNDPQPPVEVHVSIGHIEVRSAEPPKPPTKPATKPHLSLEEYLRRRNGALR